MNDYISRHFKKHYNQTATRDQWRSVDVNGNPLPWMTYSAIFQLEQFDFSSADIFEWGGGFSSLYWAARCQSLNTVEHDPEWVAFVREKSPKNLICHDVQLPQYAEYIDSFNRLFDVIIIDGYIHDDMRMKCTKHALMHIKDGGLIVLDNSDWLANTCAFLRSQGFNQNDYSGFGPINNYPWCTSLFYKGNLNLPRKELSPGFVPGGIENMRG